MPIGKRVRPRPARDFEAARGAFATRLESRDGPHISVEGRSRLLDHGRRTERAIVLLHGLTNAPEQWVPFARQLHERGDTVVIPRLPGHGHADRSGRALARVGPDDLLTTANDALDIACGAGDRTVVAGLSIGAVFALWLALRRRDVGRSVAIVPFFAVAHAGAGTNALLAAALSIVPNVLLPWDPTGKNDQIPPYAYPKFATRALAACLRIAGDARATAARVRPVASIQLALNAREPACNNAVSLDVAARCLVRGANVATVTWPDLPAIHDIVDPTNPLGRTDIVYPRLLALI